MRKWLAAGAAVPALAALAFSAGIDISFGLVAVRQVSRFSPVEALHRE